jgi:hypothetical protein
VCAIGSIPVAGREIWSGRDVYFQKVDFADWNLAENQDRITPAVWITRKNDHGIFNIAQETGYVTDASPADTEWATGNAADWASLTFQPWQVWAQNYPPRTIGADACVHLISEDIYIDIRFDSWTQGAQGGGFAYFRATGPSAVDDGTWGAVKALFR